MKGVSPAFIPVFIIRLSPNQLKPDKEYATRF